MARPRDSSPTGTPAHSRNYLLSVGRRYDESHGGNSKSHAVIKLRWAQTAAESL
jgi:hypothetical protein